MKNFAFSIWTHLRFWGENYIAMPIIIGLLLLSIVVVNLLTGREVIEDVGSIVGWLQNALGCCVVMTLAGFSKHFLSGYRSPKDLRLAADIYDSCETFLHLLLWSVLVFGLLR